MPDRSAPLALDVVLPDPTTLATPLALDRQIGASLPRLVAVMRRLLAPNGCPWDREQTPDSLKRYVLEEACEVIDAIEEKDPEHLCEELGDLLLQVVFQAELARRQGDFGPDDVVESIVEKLVRRHPHVFGDVVANDAKTVLENWEQIKAKEKGERGVLSGIPRALPSLVRAQRVGEKVARVGFDWPSIDGSRVKVDEELAELDAVIATGDVSKIEDELGDVLFALVNLARHVETQDGGGIDAEGALRRTTDKFTKRFNAVEKRVREELGGFTVKPTLAQLELFWQEAKKDD